MSIKVARIFTLVMVVASSPVAAQTPLSAIDWLSDSLADIPARITTAPDTDITRNALPDDVSVSDLERPLPDGVGLLPASLSGLPRNLWGQSRSLDLAARLQGDFSQALPAMQQMLYKLLLAELDPPFDSGAEASLYLARLDTLLSLGALEQAQSLLELSGQDRPALFRRAFDISLLLYTENSACETLRLTPGLSPTFPARIFCLARGGDWDAAALSLETGRALGYLTDYEDALVARFLDPVLFEGEPAPEIPARPSPLVFRMLGAIGEPIPTTVLPRAFSQADLNANAGWKAQIEAAERLVRTGAIDANRLLGLYAERRPAASGGVWDRVAAVQALDRALEENEMSSVSAALPIAWAAMAQAELEVPFATLFAHRLAPLELTGSTAELAFEIGLLSDNYEAVAAAFEPENDRQRLLISMARGEPGGVFAADPMTAALQDGFRASGVPVRLQSLSENNRLGEAVLRAMSLFGNGANGDLDELTDALAFFRAVGQEDIARRAALQLLLLERRG